MQQKDTQSKDCQRIEINVDTARLWRDRWVGLQGIDLEEMSAEDRLEDAPRPGAPSSITEEQRCRRQLWSRGSIETGRPISQWTGREMLTK